MTKKQNKILPNPFSKFDIGHFKNERPDLGQGSIREPAKFFFSKSHTGFVYKSKKNCKIGRMSKKLLSLEKKRQSF